MISKKLLAKAKKNHQRITPKSLLSKTQVTNKATSKNKSHSQFEFNFNSTNAVSKSTKNNITLDYEKRGAIPA